MNNYVKAFTILKSNLHESDKFDAKKGSRGTCMEVSTLVEVSALDLLLVDIARRVRGVSNDVNQSLLNYLLSLTARPHAPPFAARGYA